MRNFIILLIFSIASFSVFAQDKDSDFNPNEVNKNTAGGEVREYLVDGFDNESTWHPIISKDVAFGTVNFFPREKQDKGGEKYNINNEVIKSEEGHRDLVLGVKFQYVKRASKEYAIIQRSAPARLAGVAKAFSIWVCGRNYAHKLFLRVKTQDGRISDLPFNNGSPLTFYGWKKVHCPVPANLDQEDFPYSFRSNFTVIGIKLEFNQEDMNRDLYIYFDDLVAYTDVSVIENYKKIDDMVDEW